MQENLKQQTVLYRITDAGVDDEIEVYAGCNISGKKKTTIKIQEKPEQEKDKD
jgi:hypothetical protein